MAKVGLAKVGLAKVGLPKVGLAKVGLAKVGLAKVGLMTMAKVGLAKVDPAARRECKIFPNRSGSSDEGSGIEECSITHSHSKENTVVFGR